MTKEMMSLVEKLWPLTRSLTGKGVRETLRLLREEIPVKMKYIKSGTKCYDWTIPKEWVFNRAYIINKNGEIIIDTKNNNLHIVGYSEPIDKWVKREELERHLHYIKEMPDAIPYVTSYYKRDWGFCISYNEFKKLKEDEYKVIIESQLIDGRMDYGEVVIKGESKEEVILSTYICHPSMMNNELSGPVVTTFITKEIMREKRRYTYRILFLPETIGSIAYISKNLKTLKKYVRAGLVLTCIGDDGPFSYLTSRYGNNLSDRVVRRVLEKYYNKNEIKIWGWTERGSDERQFCAPGVDLPMCSIMRSKYHTYPEYHTSKDDLSMASETSMMKSLEYVRRIIDLLEINVIPKATNKCEPMLGKRGLYENISKRGSSESSQAYLDILSYSDGSNDVIELSKILKIREENVYEILKKLKENKLVKFMK